MNVFEMVKKNYDALQKGKNSSATTPKNFSYLKISRNTIYDARHYSELIDKIFPLINFTKIYCSNVNHVNSNNYILQKWMSSSATTHKNLSYLKISKITTYYAQHYSDLIDKFFSID